MLKLGRRLAGALVVAAAFAAPAYAQSTLKVALHSDLKIVDPVWTTALITVNHGYMIYDTLFALDEKLSVKPQMVDRHETTADKLTWTFTLRDGLEWHDGKPVTAEDCVASIKRWGARDAFGQALMARTDELIAPDDKTIVFRLKQPLALLPDALGHGASNMCAITPKHIAETDPFKQVTEIVGSGPFRFKPDERVQGSRFAKPWNRPASQ